jgi:hypothetical protein
MYSLPTERDDSERLPVARGGNELGMEPRHQDLAAEEAAAERTEHDEDDPTSGNPVDDVARRGDDTGHDAEIEDQSGL